MRPHFSSNQDPQRKVRTLRELSTSPNKQDARCGDALVVKYLASDDYKALALATQAHRRRILDSFRACTTPEAATARRQFSAHHEAQGDHSRARGSATDRAEGLAESVCIEQGEVTVDITVGIKPTRAAASDGFLTLEAEQIEAYRDRYPLGTMPRLALELLLNTAARRGDAHLLGRQHLRDGCLKWRPS